MKKSMLTVCVLLSAFSAPAQISSDQVTPVQNQQSKFMATGFGYAGFAKTDHGDLSFGPNGFAPVFLWKKSDRLFFEAELEIALEHGVDINLEYATLHYRLCKYLTVGAGKFLSPFGLFNERLHPAWINKFADKPLGFNHDAGALVGPMAELGVQLRGGTQLGRSKINYVGYISNGPSLVADPDEPMMSGMLMYDNVEDNNDNKAIGGRIGLLPFHNSSLEFGLSGQVARVGDKGDDMYKDISTMMAAFDASFIHKLDFIKSNVDLKAQFNMVNVDKADKYPIDTTMDGADSTFENNSSTYFIQLAIRPAYAENNFLKNLELAGRYSSMALPEKAMWGGEFSQVTIGLNYWLSWNSVIKFNYQVNGHHDHDKGEETESRFMIQWATGL